MEPTQYLERWLWLSLFLVALALLSPSGVLLGLALWLWVQWKPRARLRWTVAGVLLVLSWAGLVVLWGTLVEQLLALRQAVLAFDGPDVLFARAWPIWVEGTLLFPTIAGLVHLFRPTKRKVTMPEQTPAQPTLPEQPTQQVLKQGKRQATLPSPAVQPHPPANAPSSRAS
ncbi:MAG TPA: hypothetical protein VKT82_29060 [Ktedonobacterales bacterium]|nr:hypothetical protein [Ktedonobacterales bacterium]